MIHKRPRHAKLPREMRCQGLDAKGFGRVMTAVKHIHAQLLGQLLAAGVTIQEYHRSFLHAKVAVVDGNSLPDGTSNIKP